LNGDVIHRAGYHVALRAIGYQATEQRVARYASGDMDDVNRAASKFFPRAEAKQPRISY